MLCVSLCLGGLPGLHIDLAYDTTLENESLPVLHESGASHRF